jgi:hypothetical protein
MNTYVTWEQAKLLKEKGFEVMVSAYFQDNGKEELIQNKYPANYNSIYSVGVTHSRPEQWQVVDWLRVNHGIWVSGRRSCVIINNEAFDKFMPTIEFVPQTEFDIDNLTSFDTPQEAYSAAFDYILKELI